MRNVAHTLLRGIVRPGGKLYILYIHELIDSHDWASVTLADGGESHRLGFTLTLGQIIFCSAIKKL